MLFDQLEKLNKRLLRHVSSVRVNKLVFALVVIFVAVGAIVYGAFERGYISLPPVIPVFEFVDLQTVDTFTLASSEPTRIRIPKVGIDTVFESPLGINNDRTIEVPSSFEEVGWYKYGPTPGELGPAVVLGHVDSYEGPAVFWPLRKLDVGDQIFIDREDGSTATFTVQSLEDHNRAGFPTEKVYSDLDYAGLRLITCSGTYDRETLTYSHNLIVFAELTE